MPCTACPSSALQNPERHHLCGLVDVAVFTIIEIEERSVLNLLELLDVELHWLPTGASFKYGKFLNDKTPALRVAVFRAGQNGNGPMASLTAFAHSALLPRLSILVGISAGLKSSQLPNRFHQGVAGLRIGTVVVPREVIDYSHAVVSEVNELGSPKFTPANRSHRILGVGLTIRTSVSDPQRKTLIKRRNDYMRNNHNTEWTGQADERSFPVPGNRTADEWKTRFLPQRVVAAGDFLVTDDDIASSNLLLKNEQVLQDLHVNRHHRVKAADMESAGFAVACEAAKGEWAVIRGVSDFGDGNKSDLFQPFAAANASAYLRHALERLDVNLLHNTPANVLNEMRLRSAQISVSAVLDAFASIFHDHLGRKVNLEIYWVGQAVYRRNDEGPVVVPGVVRDGSMKAERSGALNRFEPNRFFAFRPVDGEPRAVAQAGEPDRGPEHFVFQTIDQEENSPLKWVYAVPLYDEPQLRGRKVGVLCCTSTEPLTRPGAEPEDADRAKLSLRALIGSVRDVVTTTCINTQVWSLVRREIEY